MRNYLVILVLLAGCHQVEEIEIFEQDAQKVEVISDFCDGDTLVSEEFEEVCKFGCVELGQDSARCLDPCEDNPCETPEPECETANFLAEYNQMICVVVDGESYKCVKDQPATRTLCGCVEADDESLAHCYGD